MSKRAKLIIVDLIFLGLDILIGYGLFSFYFWLFDNQIILAILLLVTLYYLGKQGLKFLRDLSEHFRLTD